MSDKTIEALIGLLNAQGEQIQLLNKRLDLQSEQIKKLIKEIK